MIVTTRPLTTTDLVAGLVGIPSLSGQERTATGWLRDAMEAFGWDAWIDPAGNVLGHRGDGEREIVLLGHIDTVPGEIPVRIEEGILHGRGAVDAKGPLAAFVAAGARARLPEGVRLTVIGAVGEETLGSPGATYLRDEYPAPAALIIGEPSGWDGVVLGYKGSLGLTASIERAMTHSSGPDATAAELAIAFWNRLTAWLADWNGASEPGFASLDATLRACTTTSDGLHERAELAITFRLPVGVTSAWLVEQVAALAGEVTLAWQANAEAYRTDKRSPLVAPFLAAIRAQGGTPRLKVKTGTSDMNVVAPRWQCPAIAYGPGDARYDHTPDEQLDLTDYERAIAVLTAAIERVALQEAEGRRQKADVSGRPEQSGTGRHGDDATS